MKRRVQKKVTNKATNYAVIIYIEKVTVPIENIKTGYLQSISLPYNKSIRRYEEAML